MGYETLAEVEALAAKTRRYEYVAFSRTITAKGSGQAVLRCMGAGGGGASASNGLGGNGGTVHGLSNASSGRLGGARYLTRHQPFRDNSPDRKTLVSTRTSWPTALKEAQT